MTLIHPSSHADGLYKTVVACVHFLTPLGVPCFELEELVGVLLSQSFLLLQFLFQTKQIVLSFQFRVVGGLYLRPEVQDILLSFLQGSSKNSELVCVTARSLLGALSVVSLLGKSLYALSVASS